jgi:CBS domain-containing protein
MRARFTAVDPDVSVAEFVRDYLMGTEQRAFPVVARGQLLGLVCFVDVRAIPRDEWSRAVVSEIMTPADRVITLQADEPAARALDAMTRHDINQLPIVAGHEVVGMIHRADLLTWLSLQE